MATKTEETRKTGGRIEGGFDAIVIGASTDGLAAAAMLGKAGFKTVLLGAGGAALDEGRREFAPGFFALDGDLVMGALDPQLVEALDLYRHGLELASRRLETVYFFDDGGALLMEGDLYRTRESVAAMSPRDADAYADFVETALDAARALRPLFETGPAPALAEALSSESERFLSASSEDIVDSLFEDAHLRALLEAEAALRSAARPSEAFSFAALLRRWAGEAAGLQAASAYPAGGAPGLRRALRRAAQAANVDFRPSVGVARVLVEWDGAAGVQTDDGGQIRAPIVVNALSARQAFLDLVGPEHINIEFQAALAAPAPRIASARVNFALTGAPGDERTRANLSRRLFFAPSREGLRGAYAAARRGDVASPLVMEALIPSVFDPALAPKNGLVVSAWAHPVPFKAEKDDALAERIGEAARETLEKIAPGAAARIAAVDVRLPADEAAASGAPAEVFAARSSVLDQWARARRFAGASGIEGYYFCGPEAEIGRESGGGAGRRAAAAAMQHAKMRARS
ncbi:MAG: hypothetical protein GC153_07510 [Alphaproteobacteria bacterium]|nr:hypothetical protein [Alphaproteobacteria bacterium]